MIYKDKQYTKVYAKADIQMDECDMCAFNQDDEGCKDNQCTIFEPKHNRYMYYFFVEYKND